MLSILWRLFGNGRDRKLQGTEAPLLRSVSEEVTVDTLLGLFSYYESLPGKILFKKGVLNPNQTRTEKIFHILLQLWKNNLQIYI